MLNLFTQYLHYKGFFHDLRISSLFAGILSFQRIFFHFYVNFGGIEGSNSGQNGTISDKNIKISFWKLHISGNIDLRASLDKYICI